MDRPSDNWFVRASSLGALMKTGRAKSQPFGETALKQIKQEALMNKHGWRSNAYSKYLDKGIINEPIAIKMLCSKMGWEVPQVNDKERMYNDFCTGEPDLYIKDKKILADVKCSFDPMTFPSLDDELKNKDYIYQMQCYMWLCQVDVSYLAYCLTDMPHSMIERESYYRVQSKMNYPDVVDKDLSEIELDVENEVNKEFTFTQFPTDSKIKIFTVERDESMLEKIRERVNEAREIYDVIYSKV